MPTKDLFQSMLAFLNFPENVSVVKVRKFLQDEGLCQDELILGDEENTIYSLYSQKEVEARKARGEPVSLSLLQAMKPVEDGKTYSLLTDPAYYRERVIFPDADEGAALKQAFSSVVHWFQTFMLGCSAGVVDVAALNKYKCTRALILEFQQTKNTMNPLLSPVGWREGPRTFDGGIERLILSSWNYHYLFTANGEELSKIRRCRQCGTFFKGIRLSAAFCTSKCRMAWNYAHRG